MSLADFQNLGIYLKEKRLSAGFTQSEVSDKVNVHTQFVSNWERGLCAPPSHCFEDLIQLLKLNRETIVKVMVLDSKVLIEAKVFAKKKNSKSVS